MDDWAIGEHTPTICRLMEEGINFTNFYTPGYGGVRTFNSEFCANTGSFLASTGGYAFDYVTNNFDQSLANQLKDLGYSTKTYHYNDPNFYSRGVFEPAMGYDEYVCYADYTDPNDKWALYDEQLLFNDRRIAEDFLRDGPKLNYIITRSAHLSYKYNEMLSYYALKQYPQYRGLTGNEEEDCMYVKAKLVDDLFARLIQELEADGELENTVIVAFTDHYTYGMDDQQLVMDRSQVTNALLVEKTPAFIWSPGCPGMEVTKTLNTADLLPTVLNLLGVESEFNYLGQDAFDDDYAGYAPFPNGSWVSQGVAYNVSGNCLILLDDDAPQATTEFQNQMSNTVMDFIRINNLILETDYYKK
jgi:phosphoglycerol transferase MdoB-like AlkP superfamily enzyme